MKAVVLSCNTGGGHNAAAHAIAEAMTQRGHQAYVLDYLTLAGENVSKAVGDSYIQLVQRTPKAFGAVYDLGMAVSTHMERSPVYYANAAMARYLREYFTQNPVDVIFATHLYPAETLTWMRRHGESLPPVIAVATDYTCIPFWEETDCDRYVIPHEDLIDQFAARGVPAEKLCPLGIPVSPAYAVPVTAAEARARLSLPQDKKLYLIVGGSMGAGNLGRLTDDVSRLTGEEAELLVICGSNESMQKRLTARFHRDPRIRILGKTDQMRLLLAACNVLFTKPGGLTSTEAVAARIPLVHTEPIPGCETENRNFFLRHGLSVTGKTIRAQARAGRMLVEDEGARNEMLRAQCSVLHCDAAESICKLAEALQKDRGLTTE